MGFLFLFDVIVMSYATCFVRTINMLKLPAYDVKVYEYEY